MIYRTAPFYLERPLTYISRSHHYLTLNIWETVRHTDITTTRETYSLTKSVISNDPEWFSEIFDEMKRRAVSVTAELLFHKVGTLAAPVILILNPWKQCCWGPHYFAACRRKLSKIIIIRISKHTGRNITMSQSNSTHFVRAHGDAEHLPIRRILIVFLKDCVFRQDKFR